MSMPAGGDNEPVGDWKIRGVREKWHVMLLGQCSAGVFREDFGVGDLRLEWSENDTDKTRGKEHIPGKERGTKMLQKQHFE